METFLGANNTILNYLYVLFIYALFFLLISYPKPKLELNYRGSFRLLAIVWPLLMVGGNYLGYLSGMMSFLPWLNNIIHSFIWIGLCLTWLYYSCHHRPMLEQVALFAFISFLMKVMENRLLGTWEKDHIFMFKGDYAYIIAMSLIDGIYPVVSKWLLKIASGNRNWGVVA
jgi:hypothetical protein